VLPISSQRQKIWLTIFSFPFPFSWDILIIDTKDYFTIGDFTQRYFRHNLLLEVKMLQHTFHPSPLVFGDFHPQLSFHLLEQEFYLRFVL
jgi:hypothetical protein